MNVKINGSIVSLSTLILALGSNYTFYYDDGAWWIENDVLHGVVLFEGDLCENGWSNTSGQYHDLKRLVEQTMKFVNITW